MNKKLTIMFSLAVLITVFISQLVVVQDVLAKNTIGTYTLSYSVKIYKKYMVVRDSNVVRSGLIHGNVNMVVSIRNNNTITVEIASSKVFQGNNNKLEAFLAASSPDFGISMNNLTKHAEIGNLTMINKVVFLVLINQSIIRESNNRNNTIVKPVAWYMLPLFYIGKISPDNYSEHIISEFNKSRNFSKKTKWPVSFDRILISENATLKIIKGKDKIGYTLTSTYNHKRIRTSDSYHGEVTRIYFLNGWLYRLNYGFTYTEYFGNERTDYNVVQSKMDVTLERSSLPGLTVNKKTQHIAELLGAVVLIMIILGIWFIKRKL